MSKVTARAIGLAGLGLIFITGCGPEEKAYAAKPAYSGKKPSLPAVPSLPNKAKKEGDAYTVWGAVHDLRSELHSKDFEGKDTKIVGYIIKTNFETLCADENDPADGEEPCVPKCAVHKQGKEDPAECKPPVPTFWIAENKDEKDYKGKAIQVKGWASNFAKIYSMVEEIDSKGDEAEMQDVFTGGNLPNPLPNVGGKVKVTGSYGVTYNLSSGGTASNPRTGILAYKSIEYLEVPPMRAALPGMKLRNPEHKKE